MLRKILDHVGRLRQYFIAGHSRWFALVLSLMNFTLIFFNLLWVDLYFIPEELKDFLVFFLIFMTGYIPLSIIVGYFDLRKGTFWAETQIALEVNPVFVKLFLELSAIRNDLKQLEKKLSSDEMS